MQSATRASLSVLQSPFSRSYLMTVTTTMPAPPVPTTTTAQSSGEFDYSLSEGDVRTLRRALAVLKAARAEAKSQDGQVAADASRRVAHVLCYIAGYLDGKSAVTGLNPGFQSIFQSSLVAVTDPESLLDEFEKSLEDALEPGATRILNIIIGGGLILIGIALKQV
jgi:hypothetical protein